MNDPPLVLRSYGGKQPSTKHSAGQTFAAWCNKSATKCVLLLHLDAEIVAWIVAVMQSGGEMQGVENVSTLLRNLKLRRTKLRFPTDLHWEKVGLTARVLWRAYEKGAVS